METLPLPFELANDAANEGFTVERFAKEGKIWTTDFDDFKTMTFRALHGNHRATGSISVRGLIVAFFTTVPVRSNKFIKNLLSKPFNHIYQGSK